MTIIQALAVLRHVLGSLGGAMMGIGVGTEAQWLDISGGIMALAAILWSLYDKRDR